MVLPIIIYHYNSTFYNIEVVLYVFIYYEKFSINVLNNYNCDFTTKPKTINLIICSHLQVIYRIRCFFVILTIIIVF